MAILEVAQLEKSFGGTKVLRDISFSLEEGQALSIIGACPLRSGGGTGCTSGWCFRILICFPNIRRWKM